VTGYHSFLINFGGTDESGDFLIKQAKLVKIMDTYEVIFSHGRYLAGVHEAGEKETAAGLALKLRERLKQVALEPRP
jgi:hypothetical protein